MCAPVVTLPWSIGRWFWIFFVRRVIFELLLVRLIIIR
jgi:hypothetical protein